MNFVTAEFCTPAFATSTQRLPIVTDKFHNALVASFIDSGAWLRPSHKRLKNEEAYDGGLDERNTA